LRRQFNKIKANIGFREEVIREKKKTRYYYLLPRVKAKEKDGK
jgi:hypothetical protein